MALMCASAKVIQNMRQVANGFKLNPFTVEVPMDNRRIIGGLVTVTASAGFYVGMIIDERARVGYSDAVYMPSD